MTDILPPCNMPLSESKRFMRACDHGARRCHLDRMPAWDRINALLPGRMAVTDIDGLLEHNGQILVIEAKPAGEAPPEGQLRALHALSRLPGVDVWITRPYGPYGHLTENVVLRGGAAVDVYPGAPRPRGGFAVWTTDQYDDFIHDWMTDARRAGWER